MFKGIHLIRVILLTVIVVILSAPLVIAASSDTPTNTPIEYVQGVVLDVQPLGPTANKAQGMESIELVTVHLTSGSESGQDVKTMNYIMNRPGFDINPKVGDKIIVSVSQDLSHKQYNVADYDRIPYVYMLLGAFIVTLLAVGGRVGLKSLFVVCFAIVIILQGMIPLILKYHFNLIIITLITSALIAVVTQVTVSGWNAKTWG